MKTIQNIRKHFDVVIFIFVLYLVTGSYLCDKEIIDLFFIIIFSVFYIFIFKNNIIIKN